MTPSLAQEISRKILQLQALMVAYSTNGRTDDQPAAYKELYSDVSLDLEDAKYANPNPHKSLELFFAHTRLKNMKTWAQRRAYVDQLYADVLLDLKRAERNEAPPRAWAKANDALADDLTPIRAQWLKARNFIHGAHPDFENSVKESISAVESTLKVLLDQPSSTLGKLLKDAGLDSDVERLISQAYGYTSNRDFVRHGGTKPSTLTKAEADFFLDFAASSIVYISARLKKPNITNADRGVS